VDGTLQPTDEFHLADDGHIHTVRVVLGEKPPRDETTTSESKIDTESASK
jgi:hypothetical protein